MNISSIRTYLKARIREVDSDLKQIDDPFGEVELAEKELKTGYKILFGDVSLTKSGNHFQDTVPVTIEVYSHAVSDITLNFDKLFTKAIKVRNGAIGLKNIKDEPAISNVESSGVRVEQINENDRSHRAVLELSITSIF